LGSRERGLAAAAAAALTAMLALGLNLRLYLLGSEHEHFQVVEWVEANVPKETWVGAIQTGTLGFFHERTINLDGKVNPEALQARKEERIPEYVLERDVQFLVDWQAIARWMDLPDFAENFELIVNDPDRNLAVLKRHGAPMKPSAIHHAFGRAR
jgi:hypothetical protein